MTNINQIQYDEPNMTGYWVKKKQILNILYEIKTKRTYKIVPTNKDPSFSQFISSWNPS